ncbi:MAG: ribose 5-phosphate isomerase A [Anaerolineae bacterium]|jgi:ribose 5-phosphate isomerase A
MDIDELKRQVGVYAAELVQHGMVVGLGSGSTARFATLHLGERLRRGDLRDIVGVPTSIETATLAQEVGIPLTDLDAQPRVDLTIDGADEVDPAMNVIKGLGGFLLREKIVAYSTAREIIVVDHRKLSPRLGIVSPVPVEVIRFGWQRTREAVARTGAEPVLRLRQGQPYITDEGNYILDCRYAEPFAPHELAAALHAIPGVVEHGLFLGMVSEVIVASPQGIGQLDAQTGELSLTL